MLYLSCVRFENRYSTLTLLCLIGWILPACQKEIKMDLPNQANLEIRFNPQMQGFPLEFGAIYPLSTGESFEPSAFKFYVGYLALSSAGNNPVYSTQELYYLVDAAKADELLIHTRIPEGNYTHLEFLLGVDSVRNVSGVQSGALDPMKGMFWTWNSGYIFAKLEGFSPDSGLPAQKVEYHIGGFRHPYNAAQTIRLPINNLNNVPLKAGQTCTVELNVDLANWFTGVTPVSIANTPVSMTPGELAWSISRNFAGLFTVTNLHIEE